MLPSLVVGGVLFWQGSADAPLGRAAAADAPTPRQTLLSAGTTRIIRAGVFQMPVLNLHDLAAGPLAQPETRPSRSLVVPAALEMVPEGGFDAPIIEEESAGDPVRDDLKAGAAGWPDVDRSAKGDQRIPGLRPSVSRSEGVLSLMPLDPLMPVDGATPLARLSRQLAPDALGAPPAAFQQTRIDAELAAVMAERVRPSNAPAEGQGNAGEDGSVPLDHSLAPTGGTSPAASRPDLASLDNRTTRPDADGLVELTAVPSDAVITMATVHLTPEENGLNPSGLGSMPDGAAVDEAPGSMAMPSIGPDEGLTTAQKKRLIAGLPGLDDGVARPLTLPPVAYTKAQACLATAIYFEARSESEKGQIAVAQVIINRVRSPFYPKNVCDVVYQGASEHRWGGCQFSFACDRIKDRVTEQGPWDQSLSLAQKVMDAELWLPEVGNATHYHATYVRPRWVRDMREMDRIGRHIFYRVKWWA